MSDTKALITFIALSVLLLIGIGLLPESEPIIVPETAAADTSAVVHVIQSNPALVKEASAGWRVTVQEY